MILNTLHPDANNIKLEIFQKRLSLHAQNLEAIKLQQYHA